MANNRNKPQDENTSLEVFLTAQNEQHKRERDADAKDRDKQIEVQKDTSKAIKAIFTPISKSQTLLVDFNKNQESLNKIIKSELAINNELLKENITNTKALFSLLEKAFDPSRKPKETKAKNIKDRDGNGRDDNFDQKSRAEQSILGTHDSITPVLSSIKSDTSEIVKLLKAQLKEKNEDVKPKNDSSWFDKMPNSAKFLPWVMPLVAAVAASRYPEVSNGVKAGLGVATAATRVATPILEAAKAGASTASGLSKVGAAAAAARAASTGTAIKTALSGPAKVGTVGKVAAGLGVGATIGRAMEGDTAGATAQGISTLLPLILAKTKYGKLAGLASAGIDVGLLGRDYIRYQDAKSEAEANGDTLKSPLQNFKDDVSKVGAFFGIGNGPENSDPLVQNTAETNKILEEIRDNKSAAGGITSTANSMIAPAIAAGGTALLMRGMAANKFGPGIATSGLGQRLLGSASTAAKAAPGLLKSGASVAGKAAGKLLPGVGLVMGAYGAYTKAQEGDYTGAALEGASGIASLIPGIGTAVAIGLQGISATRDVIKATNAETTNNIKSTNDQVNKSIVSNSEATNEKLVSSTTDTNKLLTKNNDSLSASILATSQLTNKNLTDTSKTANNSLVQSATTLTNTSNTLSSTLTQSASTLLTMIGKLSFPGLVQTGYQAVSNWFGGNAPAANSAASPHQGLHESRKNNMVTVYNSLLKAGMNDNQARIMTAEIGRENSFGNNLWKSHVDDKNGKLNVGMMSWQGDRAERLMAHLKKKGLVNPDGSIQRSQAAIDAQSEFIVQEMRGSYSKVGKKFLDNKNISYQDGSKILGEDYIQWAYNNPKYASGHTNRDRFYADINSELYRRGMTPSQKKVKYISQKEYDKLSKAETAPPGFASAKIQKEYKAREAERLKKFTVVQNGIMSGDYRVGEAPKQSKKDTKVKGVPYANPQAATAKDEGAGKAVPVNNKEFYSIGVKNVVVANGVDMSGLKPECRDAFFTMIGELFATKPPKKKPVVTSAFRSAGKQQALWDAELKKQNGDESKARKNVAKPGNSKHEQGLALDVDYKGGATVKLLESSGLLAKYNFSRPLSHEPWHIEYGSGSAVSAAAGALGDAAGDFMSGPDFQSAGAVWDAAKTLTATGLSAILTNDAMDSVREFIKGGVIDKPKDRYGRPTAAGTFTKDVSDPSKRMPKDSGNGDFWENLDQQLGDGTLQRQERNQAEYDKVKKAFGGREGIFRQIGGKYGWLSEIFGGLFGEDNLLSDVFGILTGSQDISGLPKLLSKSVTGKNKELDQMGVIGGGFGGGLASNNEDKYPLYAENKQPDGTISKSSNPEQIVGKDNHLDGSTTEYLQDGSYIYTRADGRRIHVNADGTIRKIESANSSNAPLSTLPQVSDGGISMSQSGYDSSLSGLDLEQMGAVNGGFGGSLHYDDSISKYEDQEFQRAKYYQEKVEQEKQRINVTMPQPIQTPTAQAPAGGKSSKQGLGGTMFTRNPDSIIQQVALAYMRSSL